MGGTKKKAVVTPKKPKKKRERKPEAEPVVEEQKIVTVSFDDHEYTGYVKADSLCRRFLEGDSSKYIWQNGSKYEGPFLQSEIQGQGKYTWPDGSTYEGALVKGKRHGHGVFVAADGVTKYEGQWSQGKRHGKGLLTFDANGESFYDGDWYNGCKHGLGRQVWPSKNTYEGHWEEGRMQGWGKMTWFENDMLEVYEGHWVQNLPQGQGKYTWHAADETLPGKEMPVQQMNNNFEGTFFQGLRNGFGKFQFANGAKYEGQWAENRKHGDGRYTFEDGRIYTGEFLQDNMATPCPGHQETSQALNLGGADNPVRRCVDISDLVGFCLPNDRVITDPEELTGFSEPTDVLREIYNILLRHLGDLKKVYAKLRRTIRRPEDDPWLAYMFQFWSFCRDMNVLAPDCPLAHIDRRILCGPRQHGEAFPEDVQDLRPLTPRSLQNRLPGDPEAKEPKRQEEAGQGEAEQELDEDEDEEEDMEEDEDAEDAEGGSSPKVSRQQSQISHASRVSRASRTSRQSRQSRQSRTSRQSRATRTSQSGGNRPRDQGSRRPTIQSLGTRQLSSFGPIDFFFEQNKFWRLSDAEAASKLVDVHASGATLMFRHFLEMLVRLGPVAYPEKQGLEAMLKALLQRKLLPKVDASLDGGGAFAIFADGQVLQVFERFHTELWNLFTENAAGVGAYALPQWAQLLDIEESGPLTPYRRNTARHFGGQQRRVHVQARMDVTIRVKDALSILFDTQLLSLAELQPLTTQSLFPEHVEIPSAATPDTEDRSSFKNTGDFPIDKEKVKALAADRTPTPPETGEVKTLDKENPQAVPDFKVDYLQVIAMLVEVYQPSQAARIRWSLDEQSAVEDLALLDYLETELTFPEFQRLLLRMASPAAQAQDVESFLTKVFLPALISAPSRRAAEPDAAVRTEKPKTPEPVEPPADAEAEADVAAEAQEPVPVEAPSFWLGFCAAHHLDIAANAAPRSWPEGYGDEVLDW